MFIYTPASHSIEHYGKHVLYLPSPLSYCMLIVDFKYTAKAPNHVSFSCSSPCTWMNSSSMLENTSWAVSIGRPCVLLHPHTLQEWQRMLAIAPEALRQACQISFSIFRRTLSAPKVSTLLLCMHLEKYMQGVNRSTKRGTMRYLASVHLL